MTGRQTIVDNTSKDELMNEIQALIKASMTDCYYDALKRIEAEKNVKRFGEILMGAKELHAYLSYKKFTTRSLSYIEKVAPQLLPTGVAEKQGKGLIFHTFFIDKAFTADETGFAPFHFISPQKSRSKKRKKQTI